MLMYFAIRFTLFAEQLIRALRLFIDFGDRQTASVYQRHCEAYGPQHSAFRISKKNRRTCLKNRLAGRTRLSPNREPASNTRLSRSFALPNHVATRSLNTF